MIGKPNKQRLVFIYIYIYMCIFSVILNDHVLKKAVPDSQWYPVNLYLIYGRYIVFFYLEKCLILTISPIGETRVLYIFFLNM